HAPMANADSVTAIWAASRAVVALGRQSRNNRARLRQGTPPDALARDHCRWQMSWLAGRCLRTAFPGATRFPVARLAEGSPLTVAGAAAALCANTRTAFPFDPLREPPSVMVSA